MFVYFIWEAPLGGLHGERQQWLGQITTDRESAAPTTAGAGWGRGDLERQCLPKSQKLKSCILKIFFLYL